MGAGSASRHERVLRLRDESESPDPFVRYAATLRLISQGHYLAYSDAIHAARLALSGAHAPAIEDDEEHFDPRERYGFGSCGRGTCVEPCGPNGGCVR